MRCQIKSGVALIGFSPGLGPDLAMDREAGLPPGEKALRPLHAEEFLADKIGQDLVAEDLGEPRVVDPWDLMEDACLVHSALSHQKVEVRVKIDPVPKGLDGRDDAGRKRAPGQDLEVTDQGP